jgi:hypothetical protein
LNVFLGDDSATGTMKPGAIDQTGLKVLELLARNDMVMNVDDHDRLLSV